MLNWIKEQFLFESSEAQNQNIVDGHFSRRIDSSLYDKPGGRGACQPHKQQDHNLIF